MSNFFDLPVEIRFMIYGHVVRDAKLKFLPSSPITVPSAQPIYAESRPLFYHAARLDVTAILDENTGVLRVPSTDTIEASGKGAVINLDPSLLQHIKLDQFKLAGQGTKQFIKSLTSLQSLTYTGLDTYLCWTQDFYESHNSTWDLDSDCGSDCGSDCDGDCGCTPNPFNEFLLDYLKMEVNDSPHKIVGRCCDPGSAQDHEEDCLGEKPIRKFVAAWDWNDRPFKLVAEVTFDDYGKSVFAEIYSMVDLDSKMMRIFSSLEPDNVLGEFKVDGLKY
ncbi:uncharacterized protein HMPREF1541_02757 [Cyphellophora europaea CBS 101466]|uniref:Uncharacterized protein n=1 Tax=Cyphellophora europaea (strain CBS 101466) TaxID=1220924 RepID=W2S6E0_CYPE1|nr:uncharacterized protein HMPREF1541_02757 [Cyphellophora europaea CBS 101466]ETN43598.1 hypothetical protein HMPREF1541_02757 [Cyphellophora europaea CBS 101466]